MGDNIAACVYLGGKCAVARWFCDFTMGRQAMLRSHRRQVGNAGYWAVDDRRGKTDDQGRLSGYRCVDNGVRIRVVGGSALSGLLGGDFETTA